MAQQTINRGTTPGDGTGEILFSAWGKVNANFGEIYSTVGTLSSIFANAALRNADNNFNGFSLFNFTGDVVTETGPFALSQATHGGKIVRVNSASPVTVTVPNNLPEGFNCPIVQRGAGEITFVPASGATLDHRQSHTKSAGQKAVVGIFVDSNVGGTSAVALLSGDTAA
jgi:hypothetical protein